MKLFVCSLVFFAIAAVALAGNESENETFANAPSKTEVALLNKLNAKCSRKHETSCMMLKLVAYMNLLMKKSSIQVADSVEIVETISEKKPEEVEPEESRALEEQDEESLIGKVAAEKLTNFVQSRSLVWNVMNGVDLVVDSDMSVGLNFPDTQQGKRHFDNSRRVKSIECCRKKKNFSLGVGNTSFLGVKN